MENATFRKWLTEQGCRFDTQNEERGEGHGTVTIHREGRTAKLPLVPLHRDYDSLNGGIGAGHFRTGFLG